ncbi:MAG: hypothetical protein Q4D92_02570 [Slackia sp.]|nr:hypothetical protein [Slackia sp.]
MEKWRKAFFLSLVMAVCFASVSGAFADEAGGSDDRISGWYMGEAVNAGHDTGFSENNEITNEDPHFGWSLGRFYVTGYTSKTGSDDVPVFLKNTGDKVALWFELEQNIDSLNGIEGLSVSRDENGFDQRFQVGKTDFGRGTLIVRHTDYRNAASDPIVYTNYLEANAQEGESVQVELFEEGDYEVTLDYELKQNNKLLFVPTPASYNDYRISFEFKVRNGNSMAYLFDTETGGELFDRAVAPHGFRIDTAGSHYLDIAVRREVMNDEGSGLTEVRLNSVAGDGSEFVDEGVYTITVKNPSTSERTEKRIYVGEDRILKAVVVNTVSVEEVLAQIEQGAEVTEDGMLLLAAETTPDSSIDSAESNREEANEGVSAGFSIAWVAVLLLAVLVVAAFAIARMRREKAHGGTPSDIEGRLVVRSLPKTGEGLDDDEEGVDR